MKLVEQRICFWGYSSALGFGSQWMPSQNMQWKFGSFTICQIFFGNCIFAISSPVSLSKKPDDLVAFSQAFSFLSVDKIRVKKVCDGRESNPDLMLGRHQCWPLHHQRLGTLPQENHFYKNFQPFPCDLSERVQSRRPSKIYWKWWDSHFYLNFISSYMIDLLRDELGSFHSFFFLAVPPRKVLWLVAIDEYFIPETSAVFGAVFLPILDGDLHKRTRS